MEDKIIFLDLETTGVNTAECEVIEAAYITSDGRSNTSLFSSVWPIPMEVSGITNIDNEDVEGLDKFKSSGVYSELMHYSQQGYIAVCHNTDFDLAVLKQHGIVFERSLCTYKLAWMIYPKLVNHKLGTLRAYFGVPHGGEAHRADYDTQILQNVFAALMLKTQYTLEELFEVQAAANHKMLNTWNFGKYKGQDINPGNPDHRSYATWWLNSPENPLFPRNELFAQHLRKVFDL